MAEQQSDTLLREIDEELRQEQLAKIWKQYGKYFVVLALAIVIGVGGYQFWVKYDRKTREALGESFAKAEHLAVANKTAEAADAFRDLAAKGGGYGLLARFQEASQLARKGDTAGAAKVYDAIAADANVESLYQGLARIQGAMLALSAGGNDGAAVRDKLAPVMTDDSPWRYSARELAAVAYLKDGNRQKARELYDALAKEAGTPQRLRQRATEMLTILR